jgi:hypothetical protein
VAVYQASVVSRPDGATDTDTVAVLDAPTNIRQLLPKLPAGPSTYLVAWDNTDQEGAVEAEVRDESGTVINTLEAGDRIACLQGVAAGTKVTVVLRGAAGETSPPSAELTLADGTDNYGGAALPTEGRTPRQFQFAVTGMGGEEIAWDFGDGTSNTAPTSPAGLSEAWHVFPADPPGPYTVTATDPTTNRTMTWTVDAAADTATPESGVSAEPRLPAPPNLRTVATTNTTADLAWEEVEGATEYEGQAVPEGETGG